MTTQHTPTPWTFEGPIPYFGTDNQFYVIQNQQGPDVITVLVDATPLGECLEQAALQIFRAVNSHAALVEALEGVIRVADRKTVEFDAARAALKLAKEL